MNGQLDGQQSPKRRLLKLNQIVGLQTLKSARGNRIVKNKVGMMLGTMQTDLEIKVKLEVKDYVLK